MSQYINKEIIMKDLTGNIDTNCMVKNDGLVEIGNDKI